MEKIKSDVRHSIIGLFGPMWSPICVLQNHLWCQQTATANLESLNSHRWGDTGHCANEQFPANWMVRLHAKVVICRHLRTCRQRYRRRRRRQNGIYVENVYLCLALLLLFRKGHFIRQIADLTFADCHCNHSLPVWVKQRDSEGDCVADSLSSVPRL